MWEKQEKKPCVAIIGTYQVGKSSLMNCILSDSTAAIGEGIPTTHAVSWWRFADKADEVAHLYHDNQPKPLKMDLGAYRKHDQETSPVFSGVDKIEFHLDRSTLAEVDLLDTPGFNSGEKGEQDTVKTEQAISDSADFLIVLLPNRQLDGAAKEVVKRAAISGKPFALIMNCFDPPDPSAESNVKIARVIEAEIKSLGIKPIAIEGGSWVWRCNVAWYWIAEMAELPVEQLPTAHKKRFQKLNVYTESYFGTRKMAMPAPDELRRVSNCLPAKEFITGCGVHLYSVPTITQLTRVMERWQTQILEQVSSTKCALSSGNLCESEAK